MNFDFSITPAAIGIWLFGGAGLAVWIDKWLQWRKLSKEDKAAASEGCMKQLELLWEETRLRRAEYMELEEKFRLCRAESDIMRRQLLGQEEEITGLKRQIAQVGSSVHHAVQDVISDVADVKKEC